MKKLKEIFEGWAESVGILVSIFFGLCFLILCLSPFLFPTGQPIKPQLVLEAEKQSNLSKIVKIEKEIDRLKNEKDSILLHTDNLRIDELQRAIDSLYNR